MTLGKIHLKLKPWEWLSFVAAGFELTGIYLLGIKCPLGFWLNIAGGACWITYSILTRGTFGLIGVCSVAAVLNVKGWLNWTS